MKCIVNIYTAIAAWVIIVCGIIIGSYLLSLSGIGLLIAVFFGLRKAIYSTNVIRIEHGNEVTIEIRGKDGSLLYDFSAE